MLRMRQTFKACQDPVSDRVFRVYGIIIIIEVNKRDGK